MNNSSQTWHHGLVARHWAEHNTEGPEIAYYHRQIERYGQPALDAGCGTGRLLIPFLRAGLDVDGCDVSADMLSWCRKRAENEGLNPHLYQQALHELDLLRTYQTIVVCGVFGIGVNRQQDFVALQRLYRHLQTGGVLLLDCGLPYADAKQWQLWRKEMRKQLPEPWPEKFGKQPPEDGSEYQLYGRVLALDPLEQQLTRQMRALLWRDGQVIAEEEYILSENLYFRNELRQMLEQAGFKIETIQGEYKDMEATTEDETIVFIAQK
jgi:SAM-dependent methyltransferase